MSVRLLRAPEVARGCAMAEAIEAVAEGFRALSEGRAHAPARVGVPLAGEGVSLAMPCSIDGWAYASVKVVNVAPGNVAARLPLIHATVVLIEARTGRALAILDGTSVTALRTGASGGVAARALARPDASVLALFGAGAQARTQLLGAAAALPGLREARVVARDASHTAAFVAWARTEPALAGVAVRAAGAGEALRGADLVVTATTSATPVFDGAALAPGVHVTAVGAFRPTARELDEATIRGARLVVDERHAAFAEAGELQGLRPEDAAELGEVLAGRAPGRTSRDERTVFKSVGNAVQDLVVAARVYERALAEDFGEEVADL